MRPDADSRPAPTEGGSVETGLGFMLGRAHRALRSAWEEDLAIVGLSAPQAVVLRAVADGTGVGLRELSRRMRTDVMNVKRLADHLQSAGLLCSREDPAHRQRRLLCATAAGRETATRVALRARAWEDHLADRLGAPALARLRALLTDLEEALAATPEPSTAGGPAPLPKREDRS